MSIIVKKSFTENEEVKAATIEKVHNCKIVEGDNTKVVFSYSSKDNAPGARFFESHPYFVENSETVKFDETAKGYILTAREGFTFETAKGETNLPEGAKRVSKDTLVYEAISPVIKYFSDRNEELPEELASHFAAVCPTFAKIREEEEINAILSVVEKYVDANNCDKATAAIALVVAGEITQTDMQKLIVSGKLAK